MNGMRTFIAIELTVGVKAELFRLQAALKLVTTCPVRWVAPENTHLTLCFLGELSSVQVELVKEVVVQIGARFAPLQLETSLLGAFPSIVQPQTVWVGLAGEQGVLSELHQCLEANMGVVGYRPEGRHFRPHLTIARVQNEATPAARQELGEALRHLETAKLPVGISELSMMKSVLRPSGAVYTCLYRARLTGAGATTKHW